MARQITPQQSLLDMDEVRGQEWAKHALEIAATGRHHTASMAAIVGGGKGAKLGEISLAHNVILFLDELPEFLRLVLETLRQPLDAGEVMISRANAHVKYSCKFF